MIKPSDSLALYWYFLTNKTSGTIYKVSFNQDKDQCGMTPLKTKDNTDDWDKIDNFDDNPNPPYNPNKDIFPNVLIEYKYEYVVWELSEDGETYVKKSEWRNGRRYYWFQSVIKSGDTYSGSKFEVNKQRDSDDSGAKDTSYADLVIYSIKEDIRKWVSSGYDIDMIKDRIPVWAKAKVNDEYEIGGNHTIVTGVQNNMGADFPSSFDDNNLMDFIYECIQEDSIKYMDNLLKPHGKKVGNFNLKSNSEDIPVPNP